MSNGNTTSPKRRYRKRRRAELEDETRLRITEAAVELHGSVGPARTTISAVAERAGVQRATVYRHFPDEEALFGACSAHWGAQHPLPDLAAWAAVGDHEERLRTALTALYGWYGTAEGMLEKTTRDAPVVPAMRPAVESMGAWFAEAVATIVRGRPERGARRRRVEAAVGHAIAFATWRSLARDQGLADAEVVGLMCGLVGAAAQK
ncbi:MAG TPA: helix-turn-helix domain-containing protein [Solirubrobacterales bacterium]|jgi:AcrR family transcriptional regulator